MATKTKFRVTKCLMNDGVRECAITSDGKKHIIEETKDGEKYFRIDNPYKNDTLLERHFHGRIGDAIQSIRDGYADVILSGDQMNVFTQFAYPIVMLDSKLGEEYRQKSVDGFKDSKFGYCIYYGNKNSFGGLYPVDENGNIAMETKPYVFSTDKEAKAKLREYIATAKKLAEDAVHVDNCDNIYKERHPSIIRNIAEDMLVDISDDVLGLKEWFSEKTFNIEYEVRQMLETV